MKKNRFLVFYTAFVVLFYVAAYIITAQLKSTDDIPRLTLPANVTTPLLGGTTSVPPENSAQAAVLIDAKSGAVLYSKNADTRLPMASTTKIMTAKIILETLPLDKTVKITKEAAFVEGSSIYLKENEEITVKTLLYGLLLESGNDAATALAIACSGSVEEFAALMNSKGNEMGLQNTSFANPHGLSSENHYTTAYELGYITLMAMKNPLFREIASTPKYTAPSLDGTFTRCFFNHNKLLRTYSGAIGVKTGYTESAGRCLVSAAERDGEMYICVTLNDRNDWADHTNLLNFAFENFDSVEIAAENIFSINTGGKRFINTEPIYLTVSSGERPVLDYTITVENGKASVDYFSQGIKLGTFHMLPA